MEHGLLVGAVSGFLVWAACLVLLVMSGLDEPSWGRIIGALAFCVSVGAAFAWLTSS